MASCELRAAVGLREARTRTRSAASVACSTRFFRSWGALEGLAGPGFAEWRRKLHELRIRAVEYMAAVQLQRGQTSAAIQSAELVLELDELRESGWRILMRAHAAAGNVGTALRELLRLGVILA